MKTHVLALSPHERKLLAKKKFEDMSPQEVARAWPRLLQTVLVLERRLGEAHQEAAERDLGLNDPEMRDAPVDKDCKPKIKDLPGQGALPF